MHLRVPESMQDYRLEAESPPRFQYEVHRLLRSWNKDVARMKKPEQVSDLMASGSVSSQVQADMPAPAIYFNPLYRFSSDDVFQASDFVYQPT